MIVAWPGYLRMEHVSEHPLWTHPTVGIEALSAQANGDARSILRLAAALAARRWGDESDVVARGVGVREGRWFDRSPRAQAFGSLKAEPAVTSSDLAVALLTAMPTAPLAPGSGVPLVADRWEEHRRRAIAAAERVTPEADPRRALAAPWSYAWSTWCHLHPNAPITREHLFASLDDVAMSVFCGCAADAENFIIEELCGRERDSALVAAAGFPRWVVPAVPTDAPTSAGAGRVGWTLLDWIAHWPVHEHALGTLLPLEAILAAGSVGWEAPSASSRLIAENTLRSAFAPGTLRLGWSGDAVSTTVGEPRSLAFGEQRAAWRSALRAIAGGQAVRRSLAPLVASVGTANLGALIAFRDHLASARGETKTATDHDDAG